MSTSVRSQVWRFITWGAALAPNNGLRTDFTFLRSSLKELCFSKWRPYHCIRYIMVEWFSTFPRFLKLDTFTAADQVYFWNFNSKNSQMWLSDCAAKFSFSKIHRDLKMHIFCKLQKSFFFLLQIATSKKKIQKISNNFVMPPTEVGQNWCLLGQRKNQKNFELLFIFGFKNKEDILESGPKTFWNTITSV